MRKKLLATVLLGIMLVTVVVAPLLNDVASRQTTTRGTGGVLDNIPFAVGDYPVPQPVPININYTLGCIYMPKPSYPSHQWSDLKMHNSKNRIKELKGQRMPLLGYYQGDSSLVLDWQIKFAVDHGITFFVFDDFWTEGHDGPVYNTSVSAFLRAQYNSYMQFALMPTMLTTQEGNWIAQRDFFINTVLPYYVDNYFNKSNYLLVDGKPLVNIYNHWSVFGDATPSQINSTLNMADAYIANNTNYTGAYWVTNNLRSSTVDFSQVKSCGFDAVMPYNVLPYLYPDGGWNNFPINITDNDPNYNWPPGIPYSTLKNESIDLHSQSFTEANEEGIKFITAISVDFDSRAYWWQDTHLYFSGHNCVDYWDLLAIVKGMVDSNPSAVPICTNTGKKMVGLGPWNEQMEATSIEPGYSAFQQGDDNHDPFFHVCAAAKVFGGPETYEHPIPGDHSRGFSAKDVWAFNFTTGAGREFWHDWSITSSLRVIDGDLGELIIDKDRCVMSTTTFVPTSNYTNFKAQLKLISGGPIDKLHLRWMSTNYSETADQFNSSPEPGGKVYDGITGISGSTYEIVDGFREYTFEVDKITANWRGRLYYLELLIYPVAGGAPMKVHIKKLWLDPPQVNDKSPIANSNGPYTGYIGQAVTFDGAGSYDPDGTITNYTWDFGDGTKGYGVNPTHAYTTVGDYIVNLTVKDDYEVKDSDTTTAVITEEDTPPPPPPPPPPPDDDDDEDPTADANGPYTGFEDVSLTFDGSGSTDDGTIVTYAWDFGDNSTGSGVSPTHTYAETGKYTVTLTVTDDGGKTDTNTTYAIITGKPDLPPEEPRLNGTTKGYNNTDYNYTVTSTDPDNDTIRYVFDWGDGTNNTISSYLASGTTFNTTHNWTSSGVYTIKVYAEDINNKISGTTKMMVFIDVDIEFIDDVIEGYLIDYNLNGTYDVFYNNATGNKTTVELQDDGTYLIDSDGDGTWNYTYDPSSGTITPLKGEKEEKEEKETTEIPWVMIAGIVVIAIIAVIVFLYKKEYF